MPEYLRPGVFIEEIERGPKPIEGVATSTAAFLGEAERGSITPRLVTSYTEYKKWFGDIFGNRDRFLPYAANGFFENGGKRLYVCRLVSATATTASKAFAPYTLNAAGAGLWGTRVYAKVEASTTNKPDPANPGKSIPVGFRLKLAYWSVPIAAPFDPFLDVNRKTTPRPTLTELFDDLVVDDPTSPDYFVKRLHDNSSLATFEPLPPGTPTALPAFGEGLLAGGADGTPVDDPDFVGKIVAGQRDLPQGLKALELDTYRDVALVHAPYPAGDVKAITNHIVEHCETMKYRFAVVDTAANQSDTGTLDPRTDLVETQYAAFYYPWLWISDPQSGVRKLVPPGGYALGVYARTDDDRGVYKSPANEPARGAVDLEFDIDDGKQEVLNPRGVNVIRKFPGRGILVWGARTLSSNSLWKYISVRRLFIFLERSIYEGTQWVVFEPNNDQLWTRVKDSIRLFLRTQFRSGALFGRTEDEAFFITCDRTTMTQDDILNGRLICEIGIAPTRPAEFVIFRIFQQTAEAQR